MNKLEAGGPEQEGVVAATREAEPREQADKLAPELSEVSLYPQGRESQTQMRDVKPKMVKLIELVKGIEGLDVERSVVERRVGEKGMIRFHAADLSKQYPQDRVHSFEYVEQTDEVEQVKVVAFIDASDGGSFLMSKEGQDGGPWVVDDIYTRDVKVASEKVRWDVDSFIRANRFRELRMAARMVRMLLSGTKETK